MTTFSDIAPEGIRSSLLMEMERRKHAEETLCHMRSNWQSIREQLSQTGITLPVNLDMEAEQLDADAAEELCQQVILARFVPEAIGRGLGKAQVETVMEGHLEAKNFEMARLLDRLRYYEAVNHEMSQRNQEAVAYALASFHEREHAFPMLFSVVASSFLHLEVLPDNFRKQFQLSGYLEQRKWRQRWVGGSIAVAASLGAAWSYMQSGRG